MAKNKIGQSIFFENPPGIIEVSTIVGSEESKGPFASYFDITAQSNNFEQKTWEKAEKEMIKKCINHVIEKSSISIKDIDLMIGGDLLNQITTSSYTARDFSLPFLGIYGACSSMIEALLLGAVIMDGGFADCVLAFSSSHYQTAERQYRTPLEYGDQYPPYKQWTVTGGGAYILGWLNAKVKITQATIGKIVDKGIKDANNMGGAMAASAADTIIQHLKDSSQEITDYDLIITGDLGKDGRKILLSLLKEKNINFPKKFFDCGAEIFKNEKKYGAGGSGCAASATLLGAYFIPALIRGDYKKILVIGTGALLSPITVMQGESIPGIAHAITLERK